MMLSTLAIPDPGVGELSRMFGDEWDLWHLKFDKPFQVIPVQSPG